MKAFGRLTIAWKLVTVAGLAIGLLLIAAAVAVSMHTSSIVAGLMGKQTPGPAMIERLRKRAQSVAEARNTAARMMNFKSDRRLHQMLAFSGRGE